VSNHCRRFQSRASLTRRLSLLANRTISGEGLPAWSPSRAAARRVVKRTSAVYPCIDLTAFLSIQLALLFLFLGTTLPADIRVPGNLPRLQNANPQPGGLREDAIRVTLTRDGRIFFRQIYSTPEELPDLIRTAVREGAERKIYLVADHRAKYQDVEVVLNQIQRSGVSSVVILANKPDAP
jgi:biopolymer transport protein ExbD